MGLPAPWYWFIAASQWGAWIVCVGRKGFFVFRGNGEVKEQSRRLNWFSTPAFQYSAWPLDPHWHLHVFISKVSSEEAVCRNPAALTVMGFCSSSCDSTENEARVCGKRTGQLPSSGPRCSDCCHLTLRTMAGHLAQGHRHQLGLGEPVISSAGSENLKACSSVLSSTASCKLDGARETPEPGCTVFPQTV